MKITKCRCCDSTNLFKYLDLGEQPLANSYHNGVDLPTYPLEVVLCKNCFLSQLSIVVPPELMFKNYLYVSGTTITFKNHCNELAKSIKKDKCSVLDVACNDGTLLESFRDLGCDVTGVDPAENLRQITKDKNIDVTVDYWNKDIKLNKSFDVITATNVFAHVNDIKGFLEACISHLNPNGTIILEFPYCSNLITNNEFDTIYHEHLSYFLMTPIKALLNRIGLNATNIKQTPIHGGSIRLYLQTEGEHCEELERLIKSESEYKRESTYQGFANRIKLNKKRFNCILNEQRKIRKIIGYGASAKANTMLNYFKADLDYIIDDNPLKQGLLTPGRNVPILSSNELKKENKPLAIVLTAWNFIDEITTKINTILEKQQVYIKYVPESTLLFRGKFQECK